MVVFLPVDQKLLHKGPLADSLRRTSYITDRELQRIDFDDTPTQVMIIVTATVPSKGLDPAISTIQKLTFIHWSF